MQCHRSDLGRVQSIPYVQRSSDYIPRFFPNSLLSILKIGVVSCLSVIRGTASCPLNTVHILSAKYNYNSLIGDLEDRGHSVNYRTLEIGSLGHYLPDAVFCISPSFQLTNSETKQVLHKASRVSIACSYHIFNSINSCSWDSNYCI